MKKRYILLPILCGFLYLTTTSELPGSNLGTVVATCSQAGCHFGGSGATTNTSLTLVDQANSQAVTDGTYKPGHVYAVTFKGSNSASMPRFGFQLRVNKGVYSSAGAGENIVANIMLTHGSTSIAGVGGVYTATANWTAPVTGSGTVTFTGIFNAVNGDNNFTGDMPATTDLVTSFTENSSGVGVNSLALADISLYPNPASLALNIGLGNTPSGQYLATVYSSVGSAVIQQQLELNESNQVFEVSTAVLAPGTYFLQLSGVSGRILKTFVKN